VLQIAVFDLLEVRILTVVGNEPGDRVQLLLLLLGSLGSCCLQSLLLCS